MRTIWIASLAVLLVACSTLQGATRLDEMTDMELDRYSARAATQVGLVASAAMSEGDLTPDDLESLALALRMAAGGGVSGLTSVATAGSLNGYASVALVLALTELEGRLEAAGGFEGGVLTPQGAEVVEAIADELDELREAGG